MQAETEEGIHHELSNLLVARVKERKLLADKEPSPPKRKLSYVMIKGFDSFPQEFNREMGEMKKKLAKLREKIRENVVVKFDMIPSYLK
jgi:hypothetical protein